MSESKRPRELLDRLEAAWVGQDGYMQKRGTLIVSVARDNDEYSEKKAAPLFNMALDGDEDASAALCYFAGKFLLKEKQLPPLLAKYVGILMGDLFLRAPRRARGASPYTNIGRDWFILEMIDGYCRKYGWQATRGEATKHNSRRVSACAQVAVDLDLNERAVEEIWAKRSKFGLG